MDPCLCDDILNEINKISTTSCSRRLLSELKQYASSNAYIHVEYRPNYDELLITIVERGKSDVFHFSVASNYPFKPPTKFCINNKNYHQFLKIQSPKTMQDLNTCYGMSCLCCHSIYCGDGWTPIFRLQAFINEYKMFLSYRQTMVYRLLTQKIINKYLISDIPLMEWL
jgi:ubiquitin-protein ligase